MSDPATNGQASATPAAAERRPGPAILRLVAAVADFTIVVVVTLPILLVWTTGTGTRDALPTAGASWLAFTLFVAYPVVGVAVYGRTCGKWLCSLKVERASGGPCGWARSGVRFAVAFGPLIVFGFLIPRMDEGVARSLAGFAQIALTVGVYTPILFDEQRRGVHDRIAGTVVVTRVPALMRRRLDAMTDSGPDD